MEPCRRSALWKHEREDVQDDQTCLSSRLEAELERNPAHEVAPKRHASIVALWRKDYVHALPALLLGIGLFRILDDSIVARLIVAVVGGLLLQGVLLLGYFVSTYFVAWIAGEAMERHLVPPKGLATTGAILLVAVALMLGQYWQRSTERRIETCLRDVAMQRRAGLLGPQAGNDVVYYCVHDYGRGESTSNDD